MGGQIAGAEEERVINVRTMQILLGEARTFRNWMGSAAFPRLVCPIFYRGNDDDSDDD